MRMPLLVKSYEKKCGYRLINFIARVFRVADFQSDIHCFKIKLIGNTDHKLFPTNLIGTFSKIKWMDNLAAVFPPQFVWNKCG